MSEQPKRRPGHSKYARLSESRGKVEQPKGQFKDLFKKETNGGNNIGHNQPSKEPASPQKE